MWKLTITQKIKSDYSEIIFDHHTEFESNNILELSALVEKMTKCEPAWETSYKIEWKGGENV